MEHIEKQKNIINTILEYRKYQKLYSSFVIGIEDRLQNYNNFGTMEKCVFPRYHVVKLQEFNKSDSEGEGGTVCVTGDTLFTTDRGCLYVKDLKIGDRVLTHKGRWRPITQLIDNGMQPVIRLTDSQGRIITTTQIEQQEVAAYEMIFDAGKLNNGVYFYTMTVDGEFIDTKRMVILR